MNIKKKYKIVVFLSFILILLFSYYTLKKENIKITVDGQEIITSSFKKNVKELLEEKNIQYDNNDKITPNLDAQLKDSLQINIVKIDVTKQKEYEEIAFEITINEDDSLLKGETEIEQEGKEGQKEIIYEMVYEDGELVQKKLVSQEVIIKPVNKIVNKGIKEEVEKVTKNSEMTIASIESTSSEIKSDSNQMSVVATAYATGTITSTGTTPKWGTIAVDPTVIPYGTKVYIPKFNMTFTAEDCGGAIKGNKIDIYMSSLTDAYNWGRQTIDIYILD